jgi:hypothetical protein
MIAAIPQILHVTDGHGVRDGCAPRARVLYTMLHTDGWITLIYVPSCHGSMRGGITFP